MLAGRGACLLAVYRGALSEGISFDDDDCRGVLCVGVPLPHRAEPRIQVRVRPSRVRLRVRLRVRVRVGVSLTLTLTLTLILTLA